MECVNCLTNKAYIWFSSTTGFKEIKCAHCDYSFIAEQKKSWVNLERGQEQLELSLQKMGVMVQKLRYNERRLMNYLPLLFMVDVRWFSSFAKLRRSDYDALFVSEFGLKTTEILYKDMKFARNFDQVTSLDQWIDVYLFSVQKGYRSNIRYETDGLAGPLHKYVAYALRSPRKSKSRISTGVQ